MENQKGSDELARELRRRLVREVSAPYFQSNQVSLKAVTIKAEIDALKEKEKAYLSSAVEEFVNLLKAGEIVDYAQSIDEGYKAFLSELVTKSMRLDKTLKETVDEAEKFHKLAYEALKLITKEVVAGEYGQGILRPHFNTGEIVRVIGAIDDVNDNLVQFAVWLTSRAEVSGSDLKRVAEICERGEQPLFHVSTKLMPLSKEEIEELCREVDNYEFLTKIVSEDSIPWSLGNVYRVDKNNASTKKTRLYMVTLSKEEAVFVKMEIGVFPHRTLTILGKINVKDREKVDEIVDYLLNWSGEERIPMDLKKVPEMIGDASGDNMAFNILQLHLFGDQPGIIIHIPALDGK